MGGGGDLLGLICPELGVAPLVHPGTDVEDEQPTPVSSPSPVVVGTVPMPASAGVDMELEHVFLEVGVLPAMVTPVVELEGESAMTPAGYPVPPIPELSVMVMDILVAASPAGLAVGSPARDESLLAHEESGCPDFTPAYGVQLHDPRHVRAGEGGGGGGSVTIGL